MSGAAPLPSGGHRITASLLAVSDAIAAILLAADLLVVVGSVLLRFLFNAPVEWADDVARGLIVGSSFFGAASALARSENAGVAFFVDRLPAGVRRVVDSVGALLMTVIAFYVAYNALKLGGLTTGQTTGAGLPLELTFYPMGVGALFRTIFAAELFCARPVSDMIAGAVATAVIVGLYLAWAFVAPDAMPSSGALMLAGFFVTLFGGLPIGFALALAALTFIWVEGTLPGVIFAQQMARGIDNFVLLAIPFFILVGYLMEANGMSVRLIELLERMVGRARGGLNVVMVLSMVIFSGISGSKMADVAAVGSVLVAAGRRSKQNPGNAVALLAASAVMAEAIPPCLNLIILGFVANISIGGLFMAGLVPAGVLALSLAVFAIYFGKRINPDDAFDVRTPMIKLLGGALVGLVMILMIGKGVTSGVATSTEVSAFAVIYAFVVGGLAFRELTWQSVLRLFLQSGSITGSILFIVAAASSVSYALTILQIPQYLSSAMIALGQQFGSNMFVVASVLLMIMFGAVLEGAPALIIFGPLLAPIALKLGVHPLHFGTVVVIAMGLGLFSPPIGLGLFATCAITGTKLENVWRPMMKYLLVLFVVLMGLVFVPIFSLWLPARLGLA